MQIPIRVTKDTTVTVVYAPILILTVTGRGIVSSVPDSPVVVDVYADGKFVTSLDFPVGQAETYQVQLPYEVKSIKLIARRREDVWFLYRKTLKLDNRRLEPVYFFNLIAIYYPGGWKLRGVRFEVV